MYLLVENCIRAFSELNITSRLSEVSRSEIWVRAASPNQIIAVSWGACKATDRRDSFATLFIQFIFRVKLSRFIFSFPFCSCSKIATNIADIRTSEIYNEVNKLKKLGERVQRSEPYIRC